MLAFIGLAAVMSTAIGRLVGTTALLEGGLVPFAGYAAALLKWWLGDMMRVLVVAPALFGFLRYSNPIRSAQRAVEACGLVAATVWVSYLIFGAPQLAGHGYYPAALAVFPFVIWAALRFDRFGASIVTLMICVVAVWGTRHGTGPFAAEDPVDSLVRWCTFANVVAVRGLLLAAARAQERGAHDLLQATHIELERRVEERTEDLEKANNELKEEMVRRRLLKGELIQIGDQQQRLIGQELHDGLGQHLTSLGLYRAAQEAINNALKYCHGHHIWVDLERAGGLQTFSISDDGVGIGPEEMERAAGLGLHSLRHRASLLGGSCTVTRNGLGGTTVAISYPLPEDSGHAQQMR